jgi:hypothetical protein
MSFPGYTDPIILCQNIAGTGLQPAVLDIGGFTLSGYPPVVQFVISGGTTNVILYGGMLLGGTTAPVIVNPQDVTGGGITSATADFYDLIPGIRYYQVNITANNGAVSVYAGPGPLMAGKTGLGNLVLASNTNQSL